MKEKEVNKMSWYFENGPESDVVVSTRIRFARNISGYNFNKRASEEELEKILNIFSNNKVVPELRFIRINELDELMQNRKEKKEA